MDNCEDLNNHPKAYLDALYQASRIIVEPDLDSAKVLQEILEQAVMATKAQIGVIHLVKGQYLKLVAIYPSTQREPLRERLDQIPAAGSTLAAKAVQEKCHQLISDVTRPPDQIKPLLPTGAELAVLFQTQEHYIGVLSLGHEEINGLDQAGQKFVMILSQMILAAVQYEETRDFGYASQAVAWLGLFGAEWQHTVHQKTFSIDIYTEDLRNLITSSNVSDDLLKKIAESLDGVERVVNDLRRIQFTSSVPLEAPDKTGGDTRIDDELKIMVARWASNRHDVECAFELNCPTVKVNIPAQWLQVAMEKLVNNALKAMPEGGRLTVATQQIDELAHITITDTGQRGIPDFALANFLKRPVRRPQGNKTPGTGKGVLIARFIACSYNGDLSLVYTGKGRGTQLLMTLPIVTVTST
ncbi:MAG: hypothetical protein KDI79_16925 [Anaerolineae bacterium]|nr:hypothetical protein [Anaerolineae bacterium]